MEGERKFNTKEASIGASIGFQRTEGGNWLRLMFAGRHEAVAN